VREQETINFTRGVPANESFPTAEIVEAAKAVLENEGQALLQYGPSTGLRPFRELIASWYSVGPDQVLAANGSLELIEFLCHLTVQPGDLVFTEAPTYDRAITLFRRHQAHVVGIPLEPDGPDVEALESQLKHRGVPRFFYVIPDFQNPAGATCSAPKRRRMIELSEQYGFGLLEDAPYRHLRYRGQPEESLFSLAPHRVLHMSSFTKLIAPGLRAGFMLGDRELIARLAKIAEDTYISPGYFAHGVATEWCRRGLLEPQVERLKALYAPRLEACLSAIDTHIPEARATRPDGGFFVSLILPDGATTVEVRAAAARRNLNLADGQAFFPNGGGERFLRLPFCALAPAQIEEGIRRLAEAISEVQRTSMDASPLHGESTVDARIG
jgi:DNA-binding transcriptional MocR family regulator